MRFVLRQAEDTDTNCAIVGDMIGASFGMKKLCEEIPDQIEIFKNCQVDDTSCTNRRPQMFPPSNIIGLITMILQNKGTF